MIEIDHIMLSEEALENLIVDVVRRQATDYSEYEVQIQVKKNQLKRKLLTGEAIIIYNAKEDSCDIIRAEDLKSFQLLIT
jgi:uncharacterized protein YheU (UPF0270 family)